MKIEIFDDIEGYLYVGTCSGIHVGMNVSIHKTLHDYRNCLGFEFVEITAKSENHATLDLIVKEIIEIAHKEWHLFNKPISLSWTEGLYQVTENGLFYNKVWSIEGKN